jgi:putative ABC transport system permease protein
LLKPLLEDTNVERVVYGDSWYQKINCLYKGKKEIVDKIINVESVIFLPS